VGGIVCILLTTGILSQESPLSAARSDSNQAGVAVFVIKNEIEKMQETLREKGHYRGKVDGVIGLRTRASIRAYQMAANLPITGQIDTETAEGLGIRPESTWDKSKGTQREVGHKEKPSAGIKRAEGRASKARRKEVPGAAAPEDKRGAIANKQQGENEELDQ